MLDFVYYIPIGTFFVSMVFSAILILTVIIASIFVLQSPINFELVNSERMSGKVFEWQQSVHTTQKVV